MPLSPTTAARAGAQWPRVPYAEIRECAERTCACPDYYIYQGRLGTCGPVAVLHALASASKERFLNLVDEVYKNPFRIPWDVRNQEDLLSRAGGLTSLLSTHLINQENNLMTYHATPGTADWIAGGMRPVHMKHWLKKFFPERKIQTYNSYFCGTLRNARDVSKLWETSQTKPLVFAAVNGAFLLPEPNLFSRKLPGLIAMCVGSGHFIQITSPFRENVRGEISFEAFNWGSIRSYTLSKAEFKKMLMKLIVAI